MSGEVEGVMNWIELARKRREAAKAWREAQEKCDVHAVVYADAVLAGDPMAAAFLDSYKAAKEKEARLKAEWEQAAEALQAADPNDELKMPPPVAAVEGNETKIHTGK